MQIEYCWQMPSKNTFRIKKVREILNNYIQYPDLWADPFANENSIVKYTNDLNEKYSTMYNMDAVDFLKGNKKKILQKLEKK